MSQMGEFILRRLSRDPAEKDYLNNAYESKHENVDEYVANLKETFPNIESLIADKMVLDIGCSEGMESLALSKLGAGMVHGIDIRIDDEKNGAVQALNETANIHFSVMDGQSTSFPDNEFDCVVTCGSFEHFQDPFAILKESKRILRKGGLIFLTSSVWMHPWGAHMCFFTKVPWVQFFFSERTIMNVRKDYRNDDASKYHEVEGGLNKVGISSFESMVKELDLEYEYVRLRPIKGLTFLTKIPVINELFTNLIIAVLRVK